MSGAAWRWAHLGISEGGAAEALDDVRDDGDECTVQPRQRPGFRRRRIRRRAPHLHGPHSVNPGRCSRQWKVHSEIVEPARVV